MTQPRRIYLPVAAAEADDREFVYIELGNLLPIIANIIIITTTITPSPASSPHHFGAEKDKFLLIFTHFLKFYIFFIFLTHFAPKQSKSQMVGRKRGGPGGQKVNFLASSTNFDSRETQMVDEAKKSAFF